MVPKVPQQKDGSKCGHYVLYYMYKFMMSCPQHFNIEEDYPGFVRMLFLLREFYNLDNFFNSTIEQMTKLHMYLLSSHYINYL